MTARQVEGPRLVSLPAPRPSAPPSDERSTSLVRDLCEVAKRLEELEEAELGLTPPEARTTELAGLLQRAVACLQLLEELHAGQADSDLFGFETEPTTLAGVPIEVSASPKLADVCFAGVLELNRAAQELTHARSDDDVLVALETAVRKLRRALRAVIETALSSGETELTFGEQLRGRDGFDLESTLAVRRLYAEFRRSLRRPQDLTAEAVLTALRYAAGGLATLMSSPAYARARISDRRLLRRLQERLLLWARSGRAVTSGLELLDDVWTCADLLRDINRRQELEVHDVALIRQLTCGASDTSERWLDQLEPLFGLDDALDLLIDQSRVDPPHDIVRQLRARLALLSCPVTGSPPAASRPSG
jgi:hypothetical protein